MTASPPDKDARSDGEALELLQSCRAEIRFESDMLSSRTDAFIALRSFLAIGYASSMSASLDRRHNPFSAVFPPALAAPGLVLALALALYAWHGIEAAYKVIGHWRDREDELLSRNAEVDQCRRASSAGAIAKNRLERGA